MRLSQMHLRTLREVPNEAEIPSHILLLRSGMIRKQVSGVYGFMNMGWRSVRKIEQIVREEDDALYTPWHRRREEDTRVKLVPYFAWGNRGGGEMRVWQRTE